MYYFGLVYHMNFSEVFQNANLLRSLSVMREGGWNRREEREKRAAAFMR